MAFDVSTLTTYTIENENLLVVKSLFGAKTAALIRKEGTVMTGVKTSEKINVLSTDAIFQSGAGCTRTSSGSTSLTQRAVTVGAVAVVEDICVKDLDRTYMSKKLTGGSTENEIPFEKEYTDLKAATIAKQLEIALWQGDTASGNVNLNKFDGLIKSIDAAAASVNGNPTGITVATGIVAANVKTVVDNMWTLLPADVDGADDIRIFCGWDIFKTFIAAYRDQNLFAFNPGSDKVEAKNGEVTIPGTNYTLTAVHGLDGTKRLFSTRMSNLFLGVDLENEEETFNLLPDQFNKFLRFDAEFKQGVNFAFPDMIVSFKLV